MCDLGSCDDAIFPPMNTLMTTPREAPVTLTVVNYPALLIMLAVSLFILSSLTSSFVVVIIARATRGRHSTTNVNTCVVIFS